MASITFKAKAMDRFNADGSIAYRMVPVPIFKRSHCDMGAFRDHEKYGIFANSDLFPNVLSRVRRDIFAGRDYLRLDAIPAGVTVNTSGFMTIVTIDV